MLGGELLNASVCRGDVYLAGPGEAAVAEVARDFVFAKQEVDAFAERVDDLFFAAEHRGQVELDVADFHAVLGQSVLCFGEFLARFEQRLAGNAADAQAGAAEARFAFDAGGVQAQLCGADGGDVSAGSAADDDQVVLQSCECKDCR